MRVVAAGSGIISSVAGTGISGFSGDGEQATAATVGAPMNVIGRPSTDETLLYVSDFENYRIRVLSEFAPTFMPTFSPLALVPGLSVSAFAGSGLVMEYNCTSYVNRHGDHTADFGPTCIAANGLESCCNSARNFYVITSPGKDRKSVV